MSSILRYSIAKPPVGVFYAMQSNKVTIPLDITEADVETSLTIDDQVFVGEISIINHIAPAIAVDEASAEAEATADDARRAALAGPTAGPLFGGDAPNAADLALLSATAHAAGVSLTALRAPAAVQSVATALPAEWAESWAAAILGIGKVKAAAGFGQSQERRFLNSKAKADRQAAAATAAAKKAGAAAPAAAKKAGKKAEATTYEPELPGAVPGAVHVRFAPEPSGYMHIGHTKAVLLNQFFARKYAGSFRLRFDDTNPRLESAEFEQSIRDDLTRLNVKPDHESRTSDHFHWLLDVTELLISQGHAYCYGSDGETMSNERTERVESAFRSTTPEENMALWKRLTAVPDVAEADQRFCVRIKMDMAADNACLRDPVIWRYVDTHHHHLGDTWKYKLYPTYDFACPLVDAREGVTWALRSLEFMDRDAQYARVVEITSAALVAAGQPALTAATVYDFSRMNLQYCVLSKRHLRRFVASGMVDGWNDPRFPTIRGLQRRGITVNALEKFVIVAGASRAANNQEWSQLWSLNKDVIDADAARYFAVFSSKTVPVGNKTVVSAPVELVVAEADGSQHTYLIDARDAASLEAYDESRQTKKCRAGVVTLMTKGNIYVRSVTATRVEADAAFDDTNFKGTTKITWIDPAQKLVHARLCYYDYLVTEPALPAKVTGDQLANIVNKSSLHEYAALAAPELAEAKEGSFIQLSRVGYFRVDHRSEDGTVVLVNVPEGSLRPQILAPIFFDEKEADPRRDVVVREGVSIAE